MVLIRLVQFDEIAAPAPDADDQVTVVFRMCLRCKQFINPSKIAKGSDLSGIRYDGLFGDRADKVANIFSTIERLAA